jgi:hypothetical protein
LFDGLDEICRKLPLGWQIGNASRRELIQAPSFVYAFFYGGLRGFSQMRRKHINFPPRNVAQFACGSASISVEGRQMDSKSFGDRTGPEPTVVKTREDGDSIEMADNARPDPIEVLRELFLLLEEYAPTWYTESLHERVMATLRLKRRPRRNT